MFCMSQFGTFKKKHFCPGGVLRRTQIGHGQCLCPVRMVRTVPIWPAVFTKAKKKDADASDYPKPVPGALPTDSFGYRLRNPQPGGRLKRRLTFFFG